MIVLPECAAQVGDMQRNRHGYVDGLIGKLSSVSDSSAATLSPVSLPSMSLYAQFIVL